MICSFTGEYTDMSEISRVVPMELTSVKICEVSKVPDFHSAPLALRPGRLSGEAAVGKSGTAWKAMEEVEGICIRLL